MSFNDVDIQELSWDWISGSQHVLSGLLFVRFGYYKRVAAIALEQADKSLQGIQEDFDSLRALLMASVLTV